jgi:putative endonuclease
VHTRRILHRARIATAFPVGCEHPKDFRAQTVGDDIAPLVAWLSPSDLSTSVKSVSTAGTYYVGVTSDLAKRLDAHNAGLSPHTGKARPWRRLVVIQFDEELPAMAFESYLKTGSGREFARRHFRRTIAD